MTVTTANIPSSARYILVVLVVSISFLFSTKPTSRNDYFGTFCNLGPYAGFMLDCDSYEYVALAQDPSPLLHQDAVRQSRPLFPLIGTGASTVTRPIVSLVGLNAFDGTFAGYVLVNFCILILSVFLFDKMLKHFTNLGTIERTMMSVFLIANQVTKNYFWDANTQMFSILVPLVCMWVFVWAANNRSKSLIPITLVSITCGLALLVYGNFILTAVCLIGSFLLNPVYRIRNLIIAVIGIIIPTASWILILNQQGVHYYNHEISHFHEFVWIWDWHTKPWTSFQNELLHNLYTYTTTMHDIAIIAAMLLIMIGFSMMTKSVKQLPTHFVTLVVFVLGLAIAFSSMMGYYRERLTFILFVPLVVLIAIFYDSLAKRNRPLSMTLLAIMVGSWWVYNIVRYGPFSLD